MSEFPTSYVGAGCVVDSDEKEKHATIYSLWTSPERRRKGDARALLRAICHHADVYGYTLRLFIGPFSDEPMNFNQLDEFYSSLGFHKSDKEYLGTEGVWRRREPRSVCTPQEDEDDE